MRAKRIAAIVMSVFMVLSLLPSAVFAAAVSTTAAAIQSHKKTRTQQCTGKGLRPSENNS